MGEGVATCLACLLLPLIIITALAMTALSIAEIVVGAIYLHDCPRERMIPIYLIVAGVFGLVASGNGFRQSHNKRKQEQDVNSEEQENNVSRCFSALVGIFVLAWFIAGNVWVFRIHGDFSRTGDASDGRFCAPVCYDFAFWTIIINYILFGLYFIASCCACCGAMCVAMSASREQ